MKRPTQETSDFWDIWQSDEETRLAKINFWPHSVLHIRKDEHLRIQKMVVNFCMKTFWKLGASIIIYNHDEITVTWENLVLAPHCITDNLNRIIATYKTLPEAQRTQGIDSISWVNHSARIVQDWFQWHFLNWLQIWSPDGAIWITSKFGHQIAPHCLGLSYWLYQLVLSWYLH